MRDENTKLLQQYKQDLERYDTHLRQMVHQCKTVLQRGSHIDLYDTEIEIKGSRTLHPLHPSLETPCFTPNRYPETHLKLALGNVSTADGVDCRGQGSAGLYADKGSREDSQDTYIPSVVEECQAPCDISSICPTIEGQLWTRSLCTVTLLNRKGQAIQTVEHSDQIKDISLSPKTNTLWICDSKNRIMELVSGQLIHRFSISERPRCLCITAQERVIVGLTKRISVFTTKGKTLLTTTSEGTEKPMVRSPYRISECPVTYNMAVVDGNFKSDGGDAKQHVVLMDLYFRELAVYGGELPSNHAPLSRNAFNPSDAAYDSVGNLVIADFNNCRVLLLSGHGQFLRVIYTDTDKLRAVGVDHVEDNLWAVVGLRNIKRLQYSTAK